MKIIALDRHATTASFWGEIARIHQAECVFGSDYSPKLRMTARMSPCILVVDTTVCTDDLIDSVKTISHDNPAVALVVTGTGFSTQKIVELLKTGAYWVFSRELSLAEVSAAMPLILEQAKEGYASMIDHQNLSTLFASVSSREYSVLQMVLEGIPNKMIAKQLNVSIRTVEARRSKVYRKLQVRSVADLVRIVDRCQELQLRFGTEVPAQSIISRKQSTLLSKHSVANSQPHNDCSVGVGA